MKTALGIFSCCCAAAVVVGAQGMGQGQMAGGAPPQPAQPQSFVMEVQRTFSQVSTNIVASAEQFPEDKYTWTPTVPAQPDNATIRSWAQLVAHMTDDANNNCSVIAGTTAPASVERGTPAPNAMSKADLVAGIKASQDTCMKAFAAVTMENMTQPSGGRGNASKLGQLVSYTAHANEHYGNMVTYMRLAGMVPPSSAGRGARGAGAAGGGRPGGAPGGQMPAGGGMGGGRQ